jgi:hypothetical protein
MWLERGLAETLPLVVFILLVVPFEPDDARVAFEGQDVRTDTVQKPAIMGNHEYAACVVENRVLEGAKCVDVQVVRRLVEQHHVTARLEQLREVESG